MIAFTVKTLIEHQIVRIKIVYTILYKPTINVLGYLSIYISRFVLLNIDFL